MSAYQRTLVPTLKRQRFDLFFLLAVIVYLFIAIGPGGEAWAATVPTPTNLSATMASSRQINLAWTDNATTETNYYVERSPNGSSSWTVVATLGANITSYQNTGLTQNTRYYYRVRCKEGTTYSSYSNTANTTTATLAAPTSLAATVASATQIALAWTDNTSYETQYSIERSPNGTSSWAVIGMVATNVTTTTNSGRTAGTAYYYRVRAYDSTNYSAYSNTANQTIRTITASAGANGAIAPSGTVGVANGSSKAFTMTPNSGYKIASVTVNGGAVATNPTYTFTNVTSNQTINATFSANTYTVTASAGPNGTISPIGEVPVAGGASRTFTITPNSGYSITNVTVDSASVGIVSSHTFTNIEASHTINAIFADITPPTGTVMINGGAAATNNSAVVLTLAAEDAGSGVSQMQFSNDGATWSLAEPYGGTKAWTLAPVDGTKTVSVKFRDSAGNWSGAYNASITLDTTIPVVIISSPITGATNNNNPLLTYSASEGTVVVKVDGAIVSKISGTTLGPLADGPHTVRVESTDAADNLGFAEVFVTVDTVAPLVTIDNPSLPIVNTTLPLSGTRGPDAAITIAVNTSASAGPLSYPTATTWACTVTGLAAGANHITATATDAAGNSALAMIKVNPGVVGLWHMDGNWDDLSGLGNHGIAYSGATFSTAAQMGAGAGFFDGTDDQVVGGSGQLPTISNSFAIVFWANPTGTRALTTEQQSGITGTSNQRYAVAPCQGSGADSCAGVSVGTNGISVFEYGGSYLPSLLVYNAAISGWNHVVVVYENKQPKLFLNGQLVRTGMSSLRAAVHPSAVFGNAGSYGPYKGLLDEVVIYNRSLTAGDVQNLYQQMQLPKVVLSSPSEGFTNDPTPVLLYSVSKGTVVVKVDGAVVSKVSGDALDPLTDGPHTVRVEATDSEMNTIIAERTFTVDTVPLVVTLTSPLNGVTYFNRPDMVYDVSGGSSLVKIDGVATSIASGSTLSMLSEGQHTVRVEATNAWGRTASAEVMFTFDSLAPMTLSNVAASSNAIDTALAQSSSIFFTINSNATVTLKIIPEKLGPTGAPIYQASRPCAAAGTYSVTWNGKDNTGNTVPDEAYLYELVASEGTRTATFSRLAPPNAGTVNCTPHPDPDFDPVRNKPMTIPYTITTGTTATLASRVTITISWGNQNFRILDKLPVPAGNHTFVWDGRNPSNKLLDNGATAICGSDALLPENHIIATGDAVRISEVKTDPYMMHLSYGQFTQIKYTLSRDANVSVSLTSPSGAVISLLTNQFRAAGPQVLTWNGLDTADPTGTGALITEAGDYMVSVQAVNPITGTSSKTKANVRIGY